MPETRFCLKMSILFLSNITSTLNHNWLLYAQALIDNNPVTNSSFNTFSKHCGSGENAHKIWSLYLSQRVTVSSQAFTVAYAFCNALQSFNLCFHCFSWSGWHAWVRSDIPEKTLPSVRKDCATMLGCPAEFLGRVWRLVLGALGFESVYQGFPNSCS